MPRRNRVDPWGDLHAEAGRGLFTGNRGCLADDAERVVRHHSSPLWITCRTAFRGWQHPLAAPRRWTPIFFLDDAVALAAGHRPCATCRRDDYRAYRDAVTSASGVAAPLLAKDLDTRLVRERHRRGRGLRRAGDRIVWTAEADSLPPGTVVVDNEQPCVVLADRLMAFSFDGWRNPTSRRSGTVAVLTPPTSVAAMRAGFSPVMHPTATGAAD